ncbi:MAG: M20 family peptidase [Clostridium sp.]|uniref:M20 family peptidase n=1 Tax=Clostridium sp. TaxID=1506 RepID=UPI003F3B0D97
MNHDVQKYIIHCEDDIRSICNFLYSNPEESYKEKRASTFICDILKKHNFDIKENILNIKNSFYASRGTGHPKIAFICEYDAIPGEGHLTGHNLLSAISVLAGLSLGNALSKLNYGSSIIIGCPGEYLGGTKETMVHQGLFDDIDAVLLIHPDIKTSESGTSSAIIPLSIEFEGTDGLSFLNKSDYTSLDAILLTLNILNSISKGFSSDLEINSILSNGGTTPLLIPKSSEGKFYIRGKTMDIASEGEKKLRLIAKTVGTLTNLEPKFSLYEPQNEELKTNSTLNRLLCNNLKESGIININPPKNSHAGLSIGSVSKKVPCVHFYVSISENPDLEYGSIDFSKATTSDYAFDIAKKAGLSLALTGLDLITNKSLLQEAKDEFYK